MQQQHVTQRLRRLRERAGLSQPELAKLCGYAHHSGYARYEDPQIFRGEVLPMGIVRKLIPHLTRAGMVTKREVMELAGVTVSEETADDLLTPSVVRTAVEALARYLAATGQVLPPEYQAQLAVDAARYFQGEERAGRITGVTVEAVENFIGFLHRGRTASP